MSNTYLWGILASACASWLWDRRSRRWWNVAAPVLVFVVAGPFLRVRR